MNERITINGDISVWATLKKQNYPKRWHGDDKAMPVNVFLIHMKKDDTEVTFTYYDSISNCSRGITTLDSEALKTAVDCILSDATCAMQSYDDFLSESGYDPEDYGTQRIYDGCKKALDKVLTLMSVDDIYSTLNNL